LLNDMNENFEKLDRECKEIILSWIDSPSPETGMTIEDLRKGLLLSNELTGNGPKNIISEDTFIKNRVGDYIETRIYRNSKIKTDKTILYLHGGGWVSCNIGTHDTFCKYLANYGTVNVVSINYRLAPENKFPAALEDVEDTIDWIKDKNNEMLFTNTDFIGIAGDSAGGNLAAATCLKMRDINKNIISLQVLIYGAVSRGSDTESYKQYGESPYRLKKETMEWFWKQYIPESPPVNPEYLEPIKARNFNKIPNCLIFTSEHDVLRDEAEEYAEILMKNNISVYLKRFNKLPHGFVNMIGKSKKAKESSIFIAKKIRDHWN